MAGEIILGIFLGIVISTFSVFTYLFHKNCRERDELERKREMEQCVNQRVQDHVSHYHKKEV